MNDEKRIFDKQFQELSEMKIEKQQLDIVAGGLKRVKMLV